MNISWRTVELLGGLLEPREREAVLGDLLEEGQGAWRAIPEVLGLYLRRQATLWREWRPWVAAFGVALPTSFLLMGFSLSVSVAFLKIAGHGEAAARAISPGFPLLAGHVLLLVGWSWTGGFLIGAVSRRTLWASLASYCAPCLFCLSRFHAQTLSKYCLLLFVLPAAAGILQGLRHPRLRLNTALAVALLLTALSLPARRESGEHWWSPHAWVLNATLTWPAWFLVATARRRQAQAASASPCETQGQSL